MRTRDFLLQAVGQQGTVRQAGGGVVVRHVLDAGEGSALPPPGPTIEGVEPPQHRECAHQRPAHVLADGFPGADLRHCLPVDARRAAVEDAIQRERRFPRRALRLARREVRGIAAAELADLAGGARVQDGEARGLRDGFESGATHIARQARREGVEPGLDLLGEALHRQVRLAGASQGGDARGGAQARERVAQRVHLVGRLDLLDHLALQARLALELHQHQEREGADGDRGERQPAADHPTRGAGQAGPQSRIAAANPWRAAAMVASISAGPWTMETKPAS